jgi:hypothetical protein
MPLLVSSLPTNQKVPLFLKTSIFFMFELKYCTHLFDTVLTVTCNVKE